MPILDCAALIQANKSLESKRLIKSFINYVLPSIERLNLQAKFQDLMAKDLPTEVEIYTYAAVTLKMDGSTMVHHGGDFLLRGTDRPLVKLATAAYPHCSKMPCGTPVNKAATSDALKLLSIILGPNVQVYKKHHDQWDSEYWMHQRVSIMAVFRVKPFNQSWPHIKEMFPEAEQISIVDDKVCWTKPTRSVPSSTEVNCCANPPTEVSGLPPRTLTVLPGVAHAAQTGWEGIDGEVGTIESTSWGIFDLAPCGRPLCAECGKIQYVCHCKEFYDDRDKKCTYCGQMIADCGEDHGDDMRWEQQYYSSKYDRD